MRRAARPATIAGADPPRPRPLETHDRHRRRRRGVSRGQPRSRGWRAYIELPADPERLGLPGTPPTVQRAADWWPSGSARSGWSTSRSSRPAVTRSSTADWLQRRGRADGPRLRPLRRPAGRPARRCGSSPPFEPAVVGTAGSSAVAPRDDKGQHRDPPRRPSRRSWRRAAGCRSTCASCSRARRSRPRSTSSRGSRRTGTDSARTSRSSATPASSRATCRRSRSACAGSCTPRSTSSGRPVDLHSGGLRRRRPEPGQRARGDHRGAQGSRRPGPRSPASTTTSCRSTEADRAAIAALPFDEEAYRDALGGPGAGRRGGLLDPRAQGRTPDPRRERHVGRLPGRGDQDDHPGPRPRQGQLPARRRTRIRTGSSSASATTSRRSRRPA